MMQSSVILTNEMDTCNSIKLLKLPILSGMVPFKFSYSKILKMTRKIKTVIKIIQDIVMQKY